MRKESKVMKQCKLMYKGLNIDRDSALHKTKLLLQNYRPVVWSTSRRADEIREEAEIYCSRTMEEALEYYANYAPDKDQEKFTENVQSLFETQWMIKIIDNAMNKMYEYPHNGKLYHEILSRRFLIMNTYTEAEMVDFLKLERSTYYDKKNEAIELFTICLWGYTIPVLRGIINVVEENETIPFFFQSVQPPTKLPTKAR